MCFPQLHYHLTFLYTLPEKALGLSHTWKRGMRETEWKWRKCGWDWAVSAIRIAHIPDPHHPRNLQKHNEIPYIYATLYSISQLSSGELQKAGMYLMRRRE